MNRRKFAAFLGAATLGLSIPQSLRLRADRVIE